MSQHWMNFRKNIFNPDLTLGIVDFDLDLDLIMQPYQLYLPQC